MKKQKFLTLFSILALCVCSLFIGVWAAKTASVSSGGTISFNATNIYANVNGRITGAKAINGTVYEEMAIFPTRHFDYSILDGEQGYEDGNVEYDIDWEGNYLEFDDEGSPIEITIVVENLATNRSLWVEIVNAFETNSLITTIMDTNGAENSACEILQEELALFTITLEPAYRDISTENGFAFVINLSSTPPSTTPDTPDGGVEDQLIYSFNDEELTAEVMGVADEGVIEVCIPDFVTRLNELTGEMAEYKVTSIYGEYDEQSMMPMAGAFMGNQTLQSVIIPSTVKTIKSGAFAETMSLRRVEMLEDWSNQGFQGVEIIEPMAFYDCVAANMYLPSTLTSIGFGAFAGNIVSSRTIPGGVKDVPSMAFVQSELLSILKFESGVETIGEQAFAGNMLRCIIIPDTVTSIGASAFYGHDDPVIYYEGTESQWQNIEIVGIDDVDDSSSNAWMRNATINYSSTGPTVCDGFYYLLDEDAKTAQFYGIENALHTEVWIGGEIMVNDELYEVTGFVYHDFMGMEVTGISYCAGIDDVCLDNSNITSLDEFAFYGLTDFFEEPVNFVITVDSIETISVNAFYQSLVTDIYFEGTEEAWNSIEFTGTIMEDWASYWETVTIHFESLGPEE